MEMMGNKRTIQLKEPEKKESKSPIIGFNRQGVYTEMPLGNHFRLDDDLTLGGDRFRDEEDDLEVGDVDVPGSSNQIPQSYNESTVKKELSPLAKAAATLSEAYKRLTDGVNTHVEIKVPLGVHIYLNSWKNSKDATDIDVEAEDGIDVDFDEAALKSKSVLALKSNLEKDWEKLRQQINDIAVKFKCDFDDVVMVLEDPNWEWGDSVIETFPF